MKIKVDDTMLGILEALSSGKPCYVEDLPKIYADEKKKKFASEDGIDECVITMLDSRLGFIAATDYGIVITSSGKYLLERMKDHKIHNEKYPAFKMS